MAKGCIGVMVELRTLVEHERPDLTLSEIGVFSPDHRTSISIVARDNERTVGRVFLVAPTHVEGMWIRESHRGGMLAHRLMKRAEEEAALCGIKRLYAYGNAKTQDYLSRLGYKKQELTVWTKDLK